MSVANSITFKKKLSHSQFLIRDIMQKGFETF